ncbi:hypothetical protein OZX73_01090 [Bifidobacterium sp. ESL0775]|uniref:YobI family P-loop NTPase n=1 Tax=Bifidobacterium sp. ESL0775 TaxID=2983230 RepID=UPI0023F70F89|nr:hypothetical protein [Bifidobacterium sp. ESL0775]WEV69521.1 hypothetical protein OZX73_01090 [Bifidobacterium sp. ESL0775]
MNQPGLSIKDTGFFVIIVILVVIGLFIASNKFSAYFKNAESRHASYLTYLWFLVRSWLRNQWKTIKGYYFQDTADEYAKYSKKQTDSSNKHDKLQTLTPQYDPEHHSHMVYIKYLIEALNNDKNRNIALSGAYGTGKSSILDGLQQNPVWKRHIFTISLSTLAPHADDNESVSNGTFKISRTESSSQGTFTVPQKANQKPPETTTRKLQRAIVKQLIFANKPNKAKQSKYTLAHKTDAVHIATESFFSAICITILLMLFGAGKRFALINSTLHLDQIPLAQAIVTKLNLNAQNATVIGEAITAFIITFLICCFFYFICAPFHITSLSFDKTAVSLGGTPNAYFDDFLDEIIYFFETNRRYTVVVFEDLDRFGEPEIFDDLRELNTLINKAPGVKQTVRFIYAIKDSIFDSDKLSNQDDGNSNSDKDQPGSSRAKFFDIIISVVPFSAAFDSTELLEDVFQTMPPKATNSKSSKEARS